MSLSKRLRLLLTRHRSRPPLKLGHFEKAVKSEAFSKRCGFDGCVNGQKWRNRIDLKTVMCFGTKLTQLQRVNEVNLALSAVLVYTITMENTWEMVSWVRIV